MAGRWVSLSMILVVSGCGAPPSTTANENSPVEQVAPTNGEGSSPDEIQPGEPGGLPDDRTLVSEGTIDPKSAQGAGLVLQRYAGMLEQHQFADARMLWSDNGRASNQTEKEFVESWSRYGQIHSEIGAPGDLEGAAGSVYVSIPLRLYGTMANGKPFNMIGSVALRRVNDVDGSTEAQRQWHIASVDMQTTS